MLRPVRKAVFPVAGLGTRFLPATKAMPKEMLTVLDRPLIQYAVDEGARPHRAFHLRHWPKGVIEDHFDIAVSSRWRSAAGPGRFSASCASGPARPTSHPPAVPSAWPRSGVP